MGKIKYLRIRNYRSIRDAVSLRLPDSAPLVLVGANNAGKSNIALALDLIVGESWPGTREPEDHEFYNRSRENSPIEIAVDVDEVWHEYYGTPYAVTTLNWRHPAGASDPSTSFRMDVTGLGERFVNNDVRGQCVCVYIGADRRLSYQLSYASKFTLLSRLMRKFHQSLTADQARTALLKDKFREVKEVFDQVDEFTKFVQTLQDQLSEFSQSMEYNLGVDFSAYDPSNYFQALRVQAAQGNEIRTFDEIGTGQEQLLAFSFVQAYAEAFHGEGGLLLLVEEPESHLHPLAQRWLAQRMNALVDAGVQVVITTHSPAFVNVQRLDGITVVRKVAGATTTRQISARQLADFCRSNGAPRADESTILQFYSAASTDEILTGLFASKVVLVEGPTEALALPVYWTRIGFDPMKEGVAVIPVHGVGNLARWWRFFSAYGIPTYPIFDNDSSDDTSGTRRTDLLSTLGITGREADELMTTADWKIEPSFSVFGEDFETAMRTTFGQAYIDAEASAEAAGLSGNPSKPLIARYVAEHIALAAASEPHRKFNELADVIRSLGGPTPASTEPPAPQSPPRS